MGIIDWVLGRKAEQKACSFDPVWLDFFGLRASKAGVSVSWERALEVSTVFVCICAIGEGVAQVPPQIKKTARRPGQRPGDGSSAVSGAEQQAERVTNVYRAPRNDDFSLGADRECGFLQEYRSQSGQGAHSDRSRMRYDHEEQRLFPDLYGFWPRRHHNAAAAIVGLAHSRAVLGRVARFGCRSAGERGNWLTIATQPNAPTVVFDRVSQFAARLAGEFPAEIEQVAKASSLVG